MTTPYIGIFSKTYGPYGVSGTTPPVNHVPVANAGQDVTIQLPTSSVSLQGAASDPDPGDTLTYAWRQITGPNTATGLPATTLNVVASNLVAGTYQFGFRSTDNHGAQSVEDFVLLTVLAAATTPGVPPPTISSVSPMGGVPGSTLVLVGTNFTGATQVSLNNIPVASYTVDSATQITAVLTAANVSGLVRVTTPGGTAVSPSVFVVVPPDRRYIIPVSNDTYAFGKAALDRVYAASTSPFISANGTTFDSISPGGPQSGYYKRVWMRDWAMAVIAYPDFVTADNIEKTLELFRLAKDTRSGFENEIPDRIFNDGTPGGHIERVPFPNQVHSVCDNQFFFIQGVYTHFLKTSSPAYYQAHKPEIDAIFRAVDLQNECVYIATQAVGATVYRTGFGFNDSIYLSGKLLYATALRHRAALQLAALNVQLGNQADAQGYVDIANAVQGYFNDPANGLWDDTVGLFRVASEIGSNIYDVWANALAVEVGLATDAHAIRIAQVLYARRAEWYDHGGVRHVMKGNEDRPGIACWPRYVTNSGTITTDPNQAGSQPGFGQYQDGGYWGTPGREMRSTMALVNTRFATKMVIEALRYHNPRAGLDMANGQPRIDNAEWQNPASGYTNPQYAATAAGNMGLVIGGGTDAAPAARYDFAQASGNFLDTAGNHQDLVRFGSPLVTRVAGPSGNGFAAAFDSTKGQYLQTMSQDDDFDILVYRGGIGLKFFLAITPNGQDQVVLSHGAPGKLCWKITYINASGRLLFQFSSDGTTWNPNVCSGAFPADGTFHRVGAGWDGQWIATINDGKIDAAGYNGTMYADPSTSFYVGTPAENPGTLGLNGAISSLEVHRYQLTVNEFAA